MADDQDQDKQKQPLTIAAPFPATQSPSAVAPLTMAPPSAFAANMGSPNAVPAARPQPVAMAAPGAAPTAPAPISATIAPPTPAGTPAGANIHAGMIAPPTPAQSGVSRLWSFEKNLPIWGKIPARIGTGILGAADAAAESLDPRLASLTPGSEINTAIKNRENEATYEKRTAAGLEQQKADAGTVRANAEQEQADTAKNKKENPQSKEPLHVAPGEMVQQPDGSWKQVGNKPPEETPQQKQQATIAEALAREGYNAAFDDKANITSVSPIAGFQPKAQPYNVAEQLHTEHPDWSPEKIQQEMSKPSFPRIMPVTDAKGNTLGYNYFQGETGGGVNVQFVPAGAGGAPTQGGVIPPKPGTSVIDQGIMAGGVQQMIEQNIFPAIDEAAKADEMGPVSGRVQNFLLKRVGDPSSPAAYLQATLDAVPMMLGRIYGYRSADYAREYNNFLNLKMDPDGLKAYLNGVMAHARTIQGLTGNQTQSNERSEGAGHSFTYKGKKYQGVPDDLYNKYKGKQGFSE